MKTFGLARKTVSKMLEYSAPPGYQRQKPVRRPKLGPWQGAIDAILEDDKQRPRKQRHTAKRIFERLRAEHSYTGGYTIVKDYVRSAKIGGQEMFIPLTHAPGEAQADFGEAQVMIAGVEQKAHFMVFDLPHSDDCFVQAFPAETTEAFLEAHVLAFEYFGGVPRRIAIDADFEGALDSLFRLQWELKQDGVDAALEQSRRGGHLWIFGAEPLLASECRVYVYNLALRLGVPVKGGGLKEGIEVFPRQDKLDHGEYGNAIRAPLGVHRKTNRRYWFYEAEATPEGQLAYVERLTKLTEAELRTFIEGMSLPEAYRPVPLAPYTPPVSSSRYPEFRILDYVRTTRKDSRNWWARCPSCAAAGHDRSGDNLAIQVKDPRFYKCWAGCTKEEIRAALGQPIQKRAVV